MSSTPAATLTQTYAIDEFNDELKSKIWEIVADSHRDTSAYYKGQIALQTKATAVEASNKISMLGQNIEENRIHQRAAILMLVSLLDDLPASANQELSLAQNRLDALESFVNQ